MRTPANFLPTRRENMRVFTFALGVTPFIAAVVLCWLIELDVIGFRAGWVGVWLCLSAGFAMLGYETDKGYADILKRMRQGERT